MGWNRRFRHRDREVPGTMKNNNFKASILRRFLDWLLGIQRLADGHGSVRHDKRAMLYAGSVRRAERGAGVGAGVRAT